MAIRVILAALGLLHVTTGLWMLADPHGWYMAVPGVVDTGPMNHHFIIDIGLAFLASGAGMVSALRGGMTTTVFALAGSTWPALHALFHICEWIAGHPPATARIWLAEGFGVVVVSLAGFALAWMLARKEGVA